MIALFALTALAIALTAGFGLGLWLLLARTLGLTTGDLAWPALVQAHGTIQLFGFSAMFLIGVGLHALPRFRGAAPTPRPLMLVAYACTASAIVLRAVAQPVPQFPMREVLVPLSGVLLVAGTLSFAIGAVRALASGANAHRADELVMAAGIVLAPVAALLVALELRDAPVVIAQPEDDRAIAAMLLGCLATTIAGVWARIAPSFVAAPPAATRPLLAGTALWLAGVTLTALAIPFASLALAIGMLVLVGALRVFGGTIARQPLVAHARLTRIAVRSAFAWALAGTILLVLYDIREQITGVAATYVEYSAARHAFALGFVTIMIYGVGARVLPSFTNKRSWSLRLQAATLVLANAGVALRVLPQALGPTDTAASLIEAASGVLAYAALAVFAVNVVRLLRTPTIAPPARGTPVPMAVRFHQ